MDALLALIPTQYLPYVTAAVTISAALATVLPAPKTPAGVYGTFFKAINFLGFNFMKAKNATTPTTGA